MESNVVVPLRLMPHVDERLREFARHRGELSKTVIMALEELNLKEIPLLQVSFKDGICKTVTILPKRLYASVKRRALERGVSVNCLLNSALLVYAKRATRSTARK